MTINDIYKLVQAFASKDQRGFITPSEFNLMAQQAELELYNERLQMVLQGSQIRKSAGYYKESLTPTLAEQDISHFLFRNTNYILTSENRISFPADYICDIASNPIDNNFSSYANIPVDIVTPENVNQILRSSLVKPSVDNPIALLTSNNTRYKTITVFPEDVDRIAVSYYLYDSKPEWGYVTVSGKAVYDPSSSTPFKISSRCHGELVIKILEYLGVSIREADLVNYSQSKEVQQDKE